MRKVQGACGRLCAVAAGWAVLLSMALTAPARADSKASPVIDPFTGFDLPKDWQEKFWAQPDVAALVEKEPKAIADLVPVQAGFRFCRCPACDAPEKAEPLEWSISKPDKLTCRQCKAEFPNDTIPAKPDGKAVPEESIEVLPKVIQKYPYHTVPAERALYPGERIYLAAKRDYEAREFLSKVALYAAVWARAHPDDPKAPAYERLAAVLILRFAQVYPAYAAHFDQPGESKFLQPANLPPPYRRGYHTGKWDWSGSLDVPLNLVIAYALIRREPALTEAGKALDDPRPARTIERDLFRASAEFVRAQPEEYSETSLYAYRGMLAVGRLLDDPDLIHETLTRLEGFAERGFFFDGLWRQGDAAAHRRVVAMLDGWIGRFLVGYHDPPGYLPPDGLRPGPVTGPAAVPMLALARHAANAAQVDVKAPEVQQVAWPTPARSVPETGPMLLGGAGLARLAVGTRSDGLEIEIRGLSTFDAPRWNRLAIRLSAGGRPVLGDLDDLPPMPDGYDRSTASHNTVAIDGLNQRETPDLARQPGPGGSILFFAAEPDFQVATFGDRQAYPHSATRYRRTIAAMDGPGGRYAVSLFEVEGGLQHDALYHAAPGVAGRWNVEAPLKPGPSSLLPDSIPYLPNARASDGRWFVQAFGAWHNLASTGSIQRPTTAWLAPRGRPGVRMHLLGDLPETIIAGLEPDPTAVEDRDAGRAALLARRRSEDGSTLVSRFVTVFEPIGAGHPLRRVGRVGSPSEAIVLLMQTDAGDEHLVINLQPGTTQTVQLADGRPLVTDGLLVRVATDGTLTMAGGTHARLDERVITLPQHSGTIVATQRVALTYARGVFQTDGPIPEAERLGGRVLLIRHGDGTSHGWTIDHVENSAGGARIYVREEPGFQIEAETGIAHYYQFPRTRSAGPHQYTIAEIARESTLFMNSH